MKQKPSSLFFIAALALMAACYSGAPKVVSNAFDEMFPEAKEVEWDQEDDHVWEAEFEMDEAEYTASFSESGEWLETEKEIDVSELPDTVVSVIAINYEGFEIEEAEWLESPGFKGFELEIIKGGETEIEMEVRITPEGKIIAEEVEADSEEQDGDEDEHEDAEGHEHGDEDAEGHEHGDEDAEGHGHEDED
jgi:hypothetical protein